MPFVYRLKSLKDLKFYIGSTKNLHRRLREHQSGQVNSTKHRRPLELWGYQYFSTIQEAARFEKLYKKSHSLLEKEIKSGKFKVPKNVLKLAV